MLLFNRMRVMIDVYLQKTQTVSPNTGSTETWTFVWVSVFRQCVGGVMYFPDLGARMTACRVM